MALITLSTGGVESGQETRFEMASKMASTRDDRLQCSELEGTIKGCTDQIHFDQRFTYAHSVCNDSIVKTSGKHGVLRCRCREAPFGRHRGARWLRHSSLRGAYHAASSFLASAPLAASDLRGLNQSILNVKRPARRQVRTGSNPSKQANRGRFLSSWEACGQRGIAVIQSGFGGDLYGKYAVKRKKSIFS